VSRWQRWLLHTANLLVSGTGLVYALMRYFMRPADEWAVVNHPWQPHVQHLHLLFAPLLVFACGWIWQGHVAGRQRQAEEPRRRTGPGLIVAFAPMIVSGYLIQTTVSDGWRQAWIALHLTSSAAWLFAFLGHWLSPRVRALRWLRAAAVPWYSRPGARRRVGSPRRLDPEASGGTAPRPGRSVSAGRPESVPARRGVQDIARS